MWNRNRRISLGLAFLGLWIFAYLLWSAGAVVAPTLFIIALIALILLVGKAISRVFNIGESLGNFFGSMRYEELEAEKIRSLAEQAQIRAGYNSDGPPLLVEDIGLLIYRGESQPKINRTTDIATDVTHVRPFVVLNIRRFGATRDRIPSTIRFNLVDQSGNLRFTARSRFATDNHFVTPSTWLPLDDQNPDGKWLLQVMAGDQPLAIHEFGWLKMGGTVRAEFTGDGEISVNKRRERLQAADVPVSLDELLADQDERSAVEVRGHR